VGEIKHRARGKQRDQSEAAWTNRVLFIFPSLLLWLCFLFFKSKSPSFGLSFLLASPFLPTRPLFHACFNCHYLSILFGVHVISPSIMSLILMISFIHMPLLSMKFLITSSDH
jgi:hypothetical protein